MVISGGFNDDGRELAFESKICDLISEINEELEKKPSGSTVGNIVSKIYELLRSCFDFSCGEDKVNDGVLLWYTCFLANRIVSIQTNSLVNKDARIRFRKDGHGFAILGGAGRIGMLHYNREIQTDSGCRRYLCLRVDNGANYEDIRYGYYKSGEYVELMLAKDLPDSFIILKGDDSNLGVKCDFDKLGFLNSIKFDVRNSRDERKKTWFDVCPKSKLLSGFNPVNGTASSVFYSKRVGDDYGDIIALHDESKLSDDYLRSHFRLPIIPRIPGLCTINADYITGILVKYFPDLSGIMELVRECGYEAYAYGDGKYSYNSLMNKKLNPLVQPKHQ